jgi:hypothetical protein
MTGKTIERRLVRRARLVLALGLASQIFSDQLEKLFVYQILNDLGQAGIHFGDQADNLFK